MPHKKKTFCAVGRLPKNFGIAAYSLLQLTQLSAFQVKRIQKLWFTNLPCSNATEKQPVYSMTGYLSGM